MSPAPAKKDKGGKTAAAGDSGNKNGKGGFLRTRKSATPNVPVKVSAFNIILIICFRNEVTIALKLIITIEIIYY